MIRTQEVKQVKVLPEEKVTLEVKAIEEVVIRKINKRRVSLLLFVLGVIFIVQSCTESVFYDNSYNFKGGEWIKTDTAKFVVQVDEVGESHDFILTLRTTKSYPYSNLWTYILVTAPDGSTSKVAQMIPLAHSDGSWIGRVSGSLVESSLRFDSKPFPLKGEYLFMITNATQETTIPHVQDISLRIE